MLLVWLSLLGFATMVFASIMVRILQDMKWHELEEFCENQRNLDKFRKIHEKHEQAGFASECLQILGTAIFLIAGQAWLLKSNEGIAISTSVFITDVFAVTSVLLVFTVWLPWAIAEYFAAPFIYYTWEFWKLTSHIFLPLRWGVDLFESLLARLAGIEKEELDEEEEFEDEVRTIVTEGLREGLLEEDAREMIAGIIELDDTEVIEIMTPRSEINAVPVESTWTEIVDTISETGRTRLPIFQESLDQIEGVLHVKDLLPELMKEESKRKPIEKIARSATQVPSSMPVDELLKHFLKERTHMALVVDEYHAVAGLVTIEDVLEEIVGEIVDEHDLDEEELIVQINPQTVEVQGRAQIEDINELLGFELPKNEQYDTVAGMVIATLQQIPKTGEKLRINEVDIDILEADRRRVQKLRLTLLDENSNSTVSENA